MRNPQDETGAVAVMAALLAVVLIGFTAFAVDLGNAMTRKRMTQTQADLAALAGAGSLPDADAAIDGALDYLFENKVRGQDLDEGDRAALKFDLTNPPYDTGKIEVTNSNTRITVVTPPATVDYGLAGVFGESEEDVQYRAVAEIRSPGAILPFFIPVGCADVDGGEIVLKQGPQSGDGGGGGSTAPPDFFGPTADPASGAAGISAVSLEVDPDDDPPVLRITGTNFDGGADDDVVMEIGFVTAGTEVGPLDVLGGEVTSEEDIIFDLSVDEAAEVLETPGTWFVQLRRLTNGNAGKWSTAENSEQSGYAFVVSGTADPADQCGEKVTGDFGLLDSPRLSSSGTLITQSQQRLDLNIAKGLDHSVYEFTGALPLDTLRDNCRISPSTPIAGGVLDNQAVRLAGGAPNCLNIFNGNKVDSATDGLVSGGALDGGFEGRLRVPTADNCDPSGGSAEYEIFSGIEINNDTMSCFLSGGTVTSFINNDDSSSIMVDDGLFSSPRFFFIPVLNYRVNPPNGYYPIESFRGAFITDEYGEDGTEQNGLQASNTKITEITVAYFSLDKLPDGVVVKPGTDTSPYIGAGPKVVWLVE